MSKHVWAEIYEEIHEDIYSYKITKPVPSEWVEENIYLTGDVSRFSGFFDYNISPYSKEIINRLDPSDPSRVVAVMKCAQSGFTQGVIIPGMLYIISENPSNMLFMAGDKELAKNSIRTRFDPVVHSSGLHGLIKAHNIRKKNQRTGDTDFSKEYAGGNLIVEGTQNADKMRQFSVQYVFADDWEAAPVFDKREGSVRKLIEGRQTSYGNMAKTFYISTPATQQTSNIEPVFLLGDQRKWHWKCPECKTFIPMEWRVDIDEQGRAKKHGGIVYELNNKNRIIKESIHYQCQNCDKGKIMETSKYDLNLTGKWIPTAEATYEYYTSYKLNALVIPPGFITWADLVRDWVEANPPGEKVNPHALKAFMNIRLGETWIEMGETPKVHQLMQNTREYNPGIIPDQLCIEDGNRGIVMLSLSCDLNGIMDDDVQDVRLDWELLAHAANGVTYSVDMGSIGTFKRARDKNRIEKQIDGQRTRWTYMHGVPDSVWPEFTKLIEKNWECQSGKTMQAIVTVIDVGFSQKLAIDFINKFYGTQYNVVGVKGRGIINYRSIQKDTKPVSMSTELQNTYIVEVDQIKDYLASCMKLSMGEGGYQHEGFMNFPKAINGKYTFKDYYLHYEAEHRVETIKNEKVVGFEWKKKHGQSANHFWDVRVYNIAARHIILNLLARSDPKNLKDLNFAQFSQMILGN